MNENQNEYVDINAHDNYPDSEQKIEIPTMKVIPLKKMCMTLGELPSSYLETMTYYEMLIWFIEYLKNTIIPTVNNNASAIQEVQSVVLALQNYINAYKDSIDSDVEELEEYMNNYFENLDVQEEINNKLDEMLEDGVLEQIIEQYLNSSTLWCFDTVADLKLSTNLINGSYAKTLGYHSLNDDGGATYKITDTASETEYQEELNNGLYATLIIPEIVTPEMFGAMGNGTTDDTIALTSMFNSNCSNYVFKKTYKFTNIDISNKNITLTGGVLYGRINFNNCNKINLKGITFNSGNSNYEEIINITNSKNIILKNCKFDGSLIKDTTKGIKLLNCTTFECNNSKFVNFDGKTDFDVLPNRNAIGENTRAQTCGIYLEEITNVSIKRCNFYYILGRAGIYIDNCSTVEIHNNNFNHIYGSAVHIGNYYKNISIKNNYIEYCAITGVDENDFLYLNNGQDGAIDIYGAENYYPYFSTDCNIEIIKNYFYECGTHSGISANYYVYTDSTKTTLATNWSNGTPIGSQPLTSNTRLQCIRLLNSYTAYIHDNLIINPHYRSLSSGTRTKYSASKNESTTTANTFLSIKSNKIILNDYASFELFNSRSIDFVDNTIEAFSSGSDYISTDSRSIIAESALFLIRLNNILYSNIVGNTILSDTFSGIYNRVGNHGNINDNTIETWSFGIYVPQFVSLNLKGNTCWVGRSINYSPTEEDGMDSGGIYVNQAIASNTSCLICNNLSPIITNVAENVLSKSNVTGTNSGNYSTNWGPIFSFVGATKLFPVNLPIDDKYYIEDAQGNMKEFDYE